MRIWPLRALEEECVFLSSSCFKHPALLTVPFSRKHPHVPLEGADEALSFMNGYKDAIQKMQDIMKKAPEGVKM